MAARRLARKPVEAYGARRQSEYLTIAKHMRDDEFPAVFTDRVP